MPGRLIVIEGIDGAGTTTQTELLASWMRGRGLLAHATREPSTGPIGTLLRTVLRGEAQMSGTAMALLFAADRMDHLAREIEPALARGEHVVTDRYYHSSLAYQAEETERAFVLAVNERARRPDLTFLLRVTPEAALARRAARGEAAERYDNDAMQARIAKNYDALARELGKKEPIVVVDGSQSIDSVQHALRQDVERLCG